MRPRVKDLKSTRLSFSELVLNSSPSFLTGRFWWSSGFLMQLLDVCLHLFFFGITGHNWPASSRQSGPPDWLAVPQRRLHTLRYVPLTGLQHGILTSEVMASLCVSPTGHGDLYRTSCWSLMLFYNSVTVSCPARCRFLRGNLSASGASRG